MECKKPEFTDEMRNKLNKMYILLKQQFWTKKELENEFNLGERQIRMMIEIISHRFPVISTSGTNSGYKIATCEQDLELVDSTWAELSSRITKLEQRIDPLIKFRQKYKKTIF